MDMVQEVMSNIVQPSYHNYHQQAGHSREFGSHGSIDVITRQDQMHRQHNMFPDIHSFDSSSMDGVLTVQGPAAMSTLQRKSETLNRSEDSATTGSVMSTGSLDDSPKQKKKNGFFSSSNKEKSQKSLFKKFRGGSNAKDHETSTQKSTSSGSDSLEDQHYSDLDRHRRRFFSHYDIGSVCASLSPSSQLKTLERRNTTTGASAASAALRSNNTGGNADAEKDLGDNVSNELVLR